MPLKSTRMELLKLKRRLKTAQRGYKLLKEKRDGLMKKFMELIRQTKEQRIILEASLADASKQFALATSFNLSKEVEQFFLLPNCQVNIEASQENVMSVWLPRFQYQIKGNFKSYSPFSAPLAMEPVLEKFWQALEKMISLAGLEHSVRLLSFEIEKTRRRVNALEYVIIPQLNNNIKYISAKLDEQERSEKIIRLKIKEMIA